MRKPSHPLLRPAALKTLLLVGAVSLVLFLSPEETTAQDLTLPGEDHLTNIRQLTFGGQNAEGYFSFDESRIIFQSTRDSLQCDQEFILDLKTYEVRLVSTGKGRTTCGYFLKGDDRILYSSTHQGSSECPPTPDFSKGYVWAVYPEFEMYTANVDGSNVQALAPSDGYDAEATVSPLGDRIVFTSTRNGDLDLYSMDPDGSDLRRLTSEIGYDGGAFYSWDGTMIVYRAWHHTDSADVATYKDLLSRNLVRPSRMEIFVMNSDGTNKRMITNLGAASFAPFFHPDNKRIIFASNVNDPRGRNFDLYLVNVDGTGLTRVTTNETFDGFPMFSRDGTKLVFASNRNGKIRGETNLFIADWKE
jgi:Tol biopolymer transport system component